MDRIWQWAWDRYGPRYSWAMCAMLFPPTLQIWLFASFLVVAFEKSHHYVEAAAVMVVAVLVFVCVVVRPGGRPPCGAVGSRRRGRSRGGPGSHLHLGSEVRCPSVRGLSGYRRSHSGCCRCDRRSDGAATGPVWAVGRFPRNVPGAGRCAQLGGSHAEAGQGRDRGRHGDR
jgi:hypothetical protein